jgi:hypothetical protein
MRTAHSSTGGAVDSAVESSVSAVSRSPSAARAVPIAKWP